MTFADYLSRDPDYAALCRTVDRWAEAREDAQAKTATATVQWSVAAEARDARERQLREEWRQRHG
jgi:hypothetical protein